MLSFPQLATLWAMSQAAQQLSPFGRKLRMWRRQRGLSQLALATLAETTPRHVSFIETGRSRPGRGLVLRLAQCMDLPVRDRNALLQSAGLNPEFAVRDLNDEHARPFRRAIRAILDRHDPFPACAMDPLGTIVMTNAGFRAFSPGLEKLTPEQSIDAFFGPGPARDAIVNWEEIAWAWVDRTRHEAARSNNPRLAALIERALGHLQGVARPAMTPGDETPVMCPQFRVGDQIIGTFVTVMRFEGVREVTVSEIRVELVFPLDEAGEAFFSALAGADPHAALPLPGIAQAPAPS